MSFEPLPLPVQKLIARMGDRFVGVAAVRGDSSDREAIKRFLLPRTENILLSHYTSWSRLEEALSRHSFCMKRIDQSRGDQESGTYPKANLHSTSTMNAELHNQFPTIEDKSATVASNEGHRTRAFEHCWFEGWDECPNMWSNYGWEGAGVCVQTRSFALFDAANQASEQFHIMLGGCFYRNDDEPIPTLIGSMPLFCKRRNFSQENEVRLIAEIDEAAFKDGADNLKWVPLKTMDFIERIVLGPKVTADQGNAVKTKIQQLLPSAAVLPSRVTASEIG